MDTSGPQNNTQRRNQHHDSRDDLWRQHPSTRRLLFYSWQNQHTRHLPGGKEICSMLSNVQKFQKGVGYLPLDLNKVSHVFLRIDAQRPPLTPPYIGPFQVQQRREKVYKIIIRDRPEWVSIDRLKPAYMLPDAQPEPSSSRFSIFSSISLLDIPSLKSVSQFLSMLRTISFYRWKGIELTCRWSPAARISSTLHNNHAL